MHYMRMVLHVHVYLDNTEDMNGPNNDQFLLTSPTKYWELFHVHVSPWKYQERIGHGGHHTGSDRLVLTASELENIYMY